MKQVVVRVVIGVILACYGIYYLVPFIPSMTGFAEGGFDGLALYIFLFMTFPGWLFLVVGVQLVRKMDVAMVKLAIGLVVLMVGVWILTILDEFFPDRVSDLFLSFGMLALAIVVYAKILWFLFPMIGFDRPTFSQSVSKIAIGLLALQFFTLVGGVLDEFFPYGQYVADINPLQFGVIRGFGPPAVAFIFYKVIADKLEAACARVSQAAEA